MELTQLIEDLNIPDLPKQAPKNFFDITGIRNKEVINSRVLSYFLNPKEEHGFDTLFYDTLLKLIEKHDPKVDLNFFRDDFEITEEEVTSNAIERDDQKKRIDLLLTGGDWAIIIENKLYHDVINPLHTYWDHTQQTHKIGIILSLFEVDKDKLKVQNKDISYINITHQELINAVSNQFSFTSAYNETSLFYLKEYFKTIETHYSMKRNIPQMNMTISELIAQKEKVNKLLNVIDITNADIANTILEIFKAKNFENFNGIGNLSKVFYRSAEIDSIFFSINTKDLLLKNTVQIHLAAFTAKLNDQLIDEMKSTTKSLVSNIDLFTVGTWADKEHTHITIYTNKKFLNRNDKFDTRFRELLDDFFFRKDGIVSQIKSLIEK
ncbi:MAG: PD-(D/E)XK nuclease family protein [Bacteroidetes bacterium]|nr:PD-(D/E)XK nuclease family protein [Bacteroidota bacterium]